jgi:DNA-binding GntR family transcriptional regulator
VTIAQRAKTMECDHGLRRQTIVQSLLAEVFEGRLVAGQHLVTQELADRFGVSHTPIREALIALAGIGIIDLLPNRGAVVRRVTEKDVREICQVRLILECEATRCAVGRAEPSALDALAEDLKGLMARSPTPEDELIRQARAVDSRLHDLVASSCGNDFLANELGRLMILFRAFRDVAYTLDETRISSGRFVAEAREHLAIVEAMRAGDRRGAARAMSRHIMTAVEYWGRMLPGSSTRKRSPRPAPEGRRR